MDSQSIPEIVLSRIWQDRQFHSEMRSTDGRRVEVIYGGVWTHADGPDFRNALIVVGGHLRRGAIELHVLASDWIRHGHGADPHYDDVVLHVVLEDDLGTPVSGPSSRPLPTIVLGAYLTVPLDQILTQPSIQSLGALGMRACLPTLAGGRPDLLHDTLKQVGWKRLTEKQLRFAQELEHLPPAEVLYRGLLDALGFSQNRAGMVALAERIPLSILETVGRSSPEAAVALLLGSAGFLPLSPTHQELIGMGRLQAERLEEVYRSLAATWAIEPLPASTWRLNRVRPQNHPVRRLASLGSLISTCGPGGLLETFLGLPLDGGRSWKRWLELASPVIGRSRCDQIAVNILAPFLAAYSEATGEGVLAEQVGALWETLPGKVEDEIARRTLRQITGGAPFPIRTAIESQGLHHIGRNGCAELRCFECPVAVLALRYEPDHMLLVDPVAGDG